MDRLALGLTAETFALDFLLGRGLKLLCRNFRCKGGELDLVMQDGPTLVVVEVRSREDQGYGTAAESIGHLKRRRIVRAAQYLLLKHRELRNFPVRFDVVTVNKQPGGRQEIEWMKAAFDAAT